MYLNFNNSNKWHPPFRPFSPPNSTSTIAKSTIRNRPNRFACGIMSTRRWSWKSSPKNWPAWRMSMLCAFDCSLVLEIESALLTACINQKWWRPNQLTFPKFSILSPIHTYNDCINKCLCLQANESLTICEIQLIKSVANRSSCTF